MKYVFFAMFTCFFLSVACTKPKPTCRDQDVPVTDENKDLPICSCGEWKVERRACDSAEGASETRQCWNGRWSPWGACWTCEVGQSYKDIVREDVCESGFRFSVCEMGEDGFLTTKPGECVPKEEGVPVPLAEEEQD